ncbi:hypothetical protein GJW-30_1_03786 [Variibacter gotjawalensis]|uniref:DUF2019 domain-containing protein n=1 Tax=Variibacter gotjawalensis TaxID=1333996 RepID=A0A0S3PZ83_9BRAD|nr:DUF2019 domain-containing protein [Variibacter gotjawalensis]NIK47066.1 hypothetical protein [Variibacter gotjawalensis]RZS48971.1 uncharacterized protein DUF2019 [Variibacter gotjawalensis]BAT61229.1 hypothetical protein GJW-30_1_03786 [Variibacter gotjawalensis]
MRKRSLPGQSNEQLVGYFIEIAVAQEYEQSYGSIAKYSRLFHQMQALVSELKSRTGDQRRLLIDLHKHENWHVRYKAAKATLAVAPVESRQLLERIAASNHFPEAGEAGMTLVALDRGIYKPT